MALGQYGFEELHFALVWFTGVCAVFTFLSLTITNMKAPYGRYSAGAGAAPEWWWGPIIPAQVAWLTQELPSALVPVAMAAASCYTALQQQQQPHLLTSFSQWSPRTALAAAFMTHYIYRSLIYPLQIKGGKHTVFTVWASATLFCTVNGFLQGWFLLYQMPPGMPWQVHHVVGLALWLAGWLGNLHSDAILRGLRRSPADKGYKIPHGGLFQYVSAANYFAETVEWVGYAVAGWAPAPAVFAAFTIANLGPRAHTHHQWYLNKFRGEYPAGRKSYIPFVW